MTDYKYRLSCPTSLVIPYVDYVIIISEDPMLLDDEVHFMWKKTNILCKVKTIEESIDFMKNTYIGIAPKHLLKDPSIHEWASASIHGHIKRAAKERTSIIDIVSNSSSKMSYLKMLI